MGPAGFRVPEALVIPGYADLLTTATRVRDPLGLEFFRYPRVYVDITICPLAVAFTVVTRKGRYQRKSLLGPLRPDQSPA